MKELTDSDYELIPIAIKIVDKNRKFYRTSDGLLDRGFHGYIVQKDDKGSIAFSVNDFHNFYDVYFIYPQHLWEVVYSDEKKIYRKFFANELVMHEAIEKEWFKKRC